MLDDPDEFAKGKLPCDSQYWRGEGHKHIVGAFLDVGHDVRRWFSRRGRSYLVCFFNVSSVETY